VEYIGSGRQTPARVPPTLVGVGQLPDNFERIAVPPTRTWHAWVLSDHYEPVASAGGRCRTYLGDLVYRAKYCEDRRALDSLLTAIRHCVLQLQQLPRRIDALGAVTAVMAVPCNPPKPVSLPHEIAAVAAAALGVPDFSSEVVKTRQTRAAKTNPGLHSEAYEVRGHLNGEFVLLVDDLYHTGTTLESVALQLRAAGAAHVVGLCVTKAHQGMSP
jgi:predicted amidophosphoribosyltransferase